MRTVRVGVFDLGSSSFHLMVVDAARDGTITPVLRRRSFLHLGTEVARTGAIPAGRASAAVRTVRRLRTAADSVGVDIFVAVATAAIRDASNGKEILARLEAVIGVPVELLSGEDEARLCFAGQRAGVWVGRDRPVLGLDLGGGSLEAAVGDASDVFEADSVAIGTARLQGELGTSEPLTAGDRAALETVTRERLERVQTMAASQPGTIERAIASGGTVRAVARLAMGLHRPPSPLTGAKSIQVNQVEVPAGQLSELADRLAALDLDARLALPGVPTRRARLLPIGAVILSTIVDSLGLSRIVVSEWGLREGAVVGALSLRPDMAPGWSVPG